MRHFWMRFKNHAWSLIGFLRRFVRYWSYLLVVFMTKGACAAMSGNPGVHCLLAGCWSTTVTSGGGCFKGWSLASASSITAELLDEEKLFVFESLTLPPPVWLVLITHLGTNPSVAESVEDKGGKSVAKSKWSLAEAAASKVSSEATELAVLFIVSNDCEGLRADLRLRLYLKKQDWKFLKICARRWNCTKLKNSWKLTYLGFADNAE